MELFKTENVVLIYEPENKLLIQRWKGLVSSQKFREAIDKIADYYKKYPVVYSITNTTEQKVISKEDSDYAAAIIPDWVKHGLRRFAIIVPKSALTQMAIKDFSKSSDKNALQMQYFDDEMAAKRWLQS